MIFSFPSPDFLSESLFHHAKQTDNISVSHGYCRAPSDYKEGAAEYSTLPSLFRMYVGESDI